MTCFNHRRGSVLLYALLAMSIMLAMGISISSLFISELRGISSGQDSVYAIYASDSATELCLYEARHETNIAAIPFTSGATYTMVSTGPGTPVVTSNCSVLGSISFGFQATGIYRNVRRTLEISQ